MRAWDFTRDPGLETATGGAVTVLAEIDRLARTAFAASFLTDSRHPLQDLGRRYSAIKVS
jgi:hypothetical protein